MVERATRYENTQRTDRLILPVYFTLAYGTILAGGPDGGRYHCSGNVPEVAQTIEKVFVIGFPGFIIRAEILPR